MTIIINVKCTLKIEYIVRGFIYGLLSMIYNMEVIKMKKTNWNTRKTIIIDCENVTASAAMLNRIGLWIQESADAKDKEGYHRSARFDRDLAKSIFYQLETMGFYDNIK